MNTPLISVVLPVYNSEKYVYHAIQSVLSQTYKNFELIIVNDCSTDSSEQVINSFNDPRIKYFKNDRNLKLVATLNFGLSQVKGDFIARMDSDDICHPQRFERQIHYFNEHPQTSILGTDVIIINEHSRVMKDGHTLCLNEELAPLFLARRCILAHPTVMIRSEVLKNGDLWYDQEFIHAEDYELWLRLSKKYKMNNIIDKLLYYRIHSESITKSNQALARSSVSKALIKHNPLHIDGEFKNEIIIAIKQPAIIKNETLLKKTFQNWSDSLIEFVNEHELSQDDRDEISKHAYGYFFWTVFSTKLFALRQDYSSILQTVHFFPLSFRILKLLFLTFYKIIKIEIFQKAYFTLFHKYIFSKENITPC